MTDHKAVLASVDDRREEVIALLSDRFAQDKLTMSEFEQRIEQTHGADTVAALEAIVSDCALTPSAAVQEKALVVPAERSLLADQPASDSMFAVFAGAERRGSWIVPRKLSATAVMGGVELDYREARFGPGVHELSVFACMGGVDVIVPEHIAVECNGSGIFGAFETFHDDGAPDSERPILRITGLAVMGAVEVQSRRPGESRRQARRRRKRELKERKRKLLSG